MASSRSASRLSSIVAQSSRVSNATLGTGEPRVHVALASLDGPPRLSPERASLLAGRVSHGETKLRRAVASEQENQGERQPNHRRKAVVNLLLASHPLPTFAVTAFSVFLATMMGKGLRGTSRIGAAVLMGQLAIGWQNDSLDAERDSRSGRPDKPIARGEICASLVRRASAGGLLATLPLSLWTGKRSGALHIGAVTSGVAYNLGLRAGPFSPLPFALSFGLLPRIVASSLPDSVPGNGRISAAGALLGVGAHLVNTLPDFAADTAEGITGLPHRIGKRASLLSAVACMLGASAILSLGETTPRLPSSKRSHTRTGQEAPAHQPAIGHSPASFAISALLGFGAICTSRNPRSRLPFGLVIAAAAVDVVLVGRESRRLTLCSRPS